MESPSINSRSHRAEYSAEPFHKRLYRDPYRHDPMQAEVEGLPPKKNKKVKYCPLRVSRSRSKSKEAEVQQSLLKRNWSYLPLYERHELLNSQASSREAPSPSNLQAEMNKLR